MVSKALEKLSNGLRLFSETIEREDDKRRVAEEAAALEARRKLHDEWSRPLSGGKARSVEARQRVKRAPFGYNR